MAVSKESIKRRKAEKEKLKATDPEAAINNEFKSFLLTVIAGLIVALVMAGLIKN